MSFVKTKEYIEKLKGFTPHFYDAECLSDSWETTPEIVARLLPPPLKPAGIPLVWAFIANYPRTNFSLPYLEAALMLAAEFNGETGFHCIAMPVTDDMAMVGGREWFGYPKKIARIALKREGQAVEGWVERHGTRFFQISAKLGVKPNSADAQAVMGKYFTPPVPMFLFKYFPSPSDFVQFDYNPRLIREEIASEAKQMEIGEAKVVLSPSANDPWSEVKVVKVFGAVYMKYDSVMLPGKVVAEVDPVKFAPYAFMRIDEGFEPVASTSPAEPKAKPRKEKANK